ncbi:hypothetical protein C8R48DRAFT_667622 [Suillus tomentosus]|nr:hypothetical protein C8R48DRAFT_667622 [Suillus tomentosus]
MYSKTRVVTQFYPSGMSFRVGYIYNPATTTHGPVILDWVSCFQFTVDSGTFLKVAYVLPVSYAQTLGSEAIYESVYMELRQGEQSEGLTQFIIPTGWIRVCMYTDHDLVTRPVLQKVAEAETEGSLFRSDGPSFDGASFEDSNFLSAFNDWIDTSSVPAIGGTTSPVSSGVKLLSQVPDDEGVPLSNGPGSMFTTFLLTPLFNVTASGQSLPGASSLQRYVLCTPADFKAGIIYDCDFLTAHFPFAHVCIQDAKALAKNYLTICGMDMDSFAAYCTQAIEEMLTVANSAGQPAESGFRCCVTQKTKDLNLYSRDAIKIVSSEYDRFKKALKDNSHPLVNCKKKLRLDGFALNTKRPHEIIPYITSITGLTAWNSTITSLEFTRSPDGNLYRRKTILILLAYRILKVVHQHKSNRSLLELFPHQYESLPEHSIALVCAMYVIWFRRVFPGHEIHKISSPLLEREACHQLVLLRRAREGTSDAAVALNRWINTCHGDGGWEQDLLSEFYQVFH